MNTEKMNIFSLLGNLWPFVKPYRLFIAATITLTFIGSLMAQVNAVVLDKAVDAINALIQTVDFEWGRAAEILLAISAVLLGKEVLSAFITFFQRYFGQKLRIYVSRDLSLQVIDKILTFRMAFFSASSSPTTSDRSSMPTRSMSSRKDT